MVVTEFILVGIKVIGALKYKSFIRYDICILAKKIKKIRYIRDHSERTLLVGVEDGELVKGEVGETDG